MFVFNNFKFNISFIWKFKIQASKMVSASASGSDVMGRNPCWKYCMYTYGRKQKWNNMQLLWVDNKE